MEHLFLLVYIIFFLGARYRSDHAIERESEKIERLNKRLEGLLEDTIEILEREAPQWLLPSVQS